MDTVKKNEFGSKLKRIMNILDIKNNMIAKSLGYDVSYISKWISGKTLPSLKNAYFLCSQIGDYISEIENAPALLKELYSKGNLSEQIRDDLYSAIEADIDNSKESIPEIECIPVITEDTLQKHISTAYKENRVLIQTDFFALQNETRLVLSGIENGKFRNPQAFIKMIISMPDEHQYSDVVYDSISLIHMLTGLSHSDFQLYHNKFSRNSFSLAVEKQYYIGANLINTNGRWMSLVKDLTLSHVDQYYKALEENLNNENLVFRKTDNDTFLLSNDYLHSIISTDIRWLFGHFTELLLPDDVFEACVEKIEDEKLRFEMIRAHQLTKHVLDTGSVSMMIYDSAFTNLIITGELDFYNRPIILDENQRSMVIENVYKLAKERECVKIINGGFSSDFKYITNPCMFLSESFCYLRLENGDYKDNLLVLNDFTIKKMFDSFFRKIWSERADVVVGDQKQVLHVIDHYLVRAKLLSL